MLLAVDMSIPELLLRKPELIYFALGPFIKHRKRIRKFREAFVICKKNTAKENSSVRKTKQNRLMLLSNCAVCGEKKSKFIENQEASSIQQ